MCTYFFYLALIQYNNLIGPGNRFQFMGNHYHSAVFHEFFDSLLNFYFILRVKRRSSLVPISTTGANPHKYGTFQKI